MNRRPPTESARARGGLLGLAAGARFGAPADALLALATARELVEPALDFRRLAARWIGVLRQGAPGMDGATRAALEHLERHDRPVGPGDGSGAGGAIGWILPIALAAFRSPRTLLSASYHAARLLEADEESVWAAVAINVAAAQFLLDHGDFVADVIEVLRVNEAPGPLVAAARQVPLLRRADLPLEPGGLPAPRRAMILALWAARHEPSLARAAQWLGAGPATDRHEVPAALGLLGVRAGDGAIPAEWLEGIGNIEELHGAADGLLARAVAARD